MSFVVAFVSEEVFADDQLVADVDQNLLNLYFEGLSHIEQHKRHLSKLSLLAIHVLIESNL